MVITNREMERTSISKYRTHCVKKQEMGRTSIFENRTHYDNKSKRKEHLDVKTEDIKIHIESGKSIES